MHAHRYQIQLGGNVPPARLSELLEEFPTVTLSTVLRGEVRDQSELQGLLRQLHDMGLELSSLRVLPAAGASSDLPSPRREAG